MSVVILVGRTREQRRRALGAEVGLDPFQRPDFLYLTATRRKADVVRAGWWDQPDKPPTFLPDVRPWGRFRDDLAARWGGGSALLGPVARDLLAGSVFRSLAGSLRVWGGLRDSPTTRRALADFAEAWSAGFAGPDAPSPGAEPYELRFPGEPEAAFGPLFAHTRSVGPALRHDAWLFLRGWRDALARSPGWADRSQVTRGLLRALSDPPPPLLATFRRWRAVIVDDLLWLPPLELAVLRAFLRRFREARSSGTAYLCLEAPVGGTREGAQRWLAEGGSDGLGLEILDDLRRTCARELADGARLAVADAEPQTLDLSDLAARDAVLPAPEVGGVRVRTYASEQAEVRAIARALKTELLAGRPADSLHVSFPALDHYAPLVRDLFTAYGIPFVIEKGQELFHAPPASAARLLLRLAVLPADAAALRSVLASGWVRAGFPVEVPLADPLLDRIQPLLGPRFEAVRAAVVEGLEDRVVLVPTMERLHNEVLVSGARGGPRDWLRDLVAWRLRDARDAAARATDDEGRARIEQRLVRDVSRAVLEVLALERLLDALQPLRGARTPREAAERFLELLASVGIRSREPEPDLDRVRARAVRANSAAIEALADLVHEVSASLEGVALATGGERPAAVELLREALEDAARGATFRGEGPRHGVQVVGLRDLHGADVPWLWVGGLGDGAMPRGPKPGFLLPRVEPALVPEVDQGAEDRAIFASLLRNAGHGERRSAPLLLSWPHSDGSKEIVPSPLVADLRALRLADGGTLGDWWAEQQVREEAALPPLLSRDELLTRPALCAALADPRPALPHDPLADPVDEPEGPAVLSASDRAAMAAWDEIVDARTADDGFGRWDGVLGLDRPWRAQALAWLGELLGVRHGGRAPLLSLPTTGLELWARCPIRFFFERVLRLEEPRAFALEPGRDESGTLVHDVLERFVGERIAARNAGTLQNAALYTMGAAEQVAAARRLEELAHAVVDERLGHRAGPWLQQLLGDLVAGLDPDRHEHRGVLARFLAEELEGPQFDAEPTFVEHRFQRFSPATAAFRMTPKSQRDMLLRAPTGDFDVQLRGTIDRVDLPPRRGAYRRGDGGLTAVVYDYKTGRTPFMDKVDIGLQLQPAVYPLAIDVPTYASGLVSGFWELTEEPGRQRRRLAVATRLWRHLMENGRRIQLPWGFKRTSLPTTMWAWRSWLRRADLYGQMVGHGIFPPTLNEPKAAGCAYCPFRRACRTEPVRTERILNPPDPAPGRVAPVFWPAPTSVLEGLEAMFGPRAEYQDEEPDDPDTDDGGPSSPPAGGRGGDPLPDAPSAPPVTDEFDDLFGDLL